MLGDVAGLVLHILIFYAIYLILAVSFNIEYGYTGLPNLGKVLFYCLGACAAGSLAAYVAITVAGFHSNYFPPYCDASAIPVMTALAENSPLLDIALFVVGLAVACAIGFVAGILASYPSIRLRGDFLAISLLALGEVVRIIVSTEKWPVGGITGLTGIPTPFAWIKSPELARLAYALVALGLAALAYIYVELLANSPWGRVLKAVRDDELAAEVYGKNPVKAKIQAMAIGSALAGLAGALYTFYIGGVYPRDFIPIVTFMVIVMVMLGGPANNKGVLLGAAIVTLIDQLLNTSVLNAMGLPLPASVLLAVPYIKYMAFGAIIVLLLLYRPQGLIPEAPLRTPVVEELRSIVASAKPEVTENQ